MIYDVQENNCLYQINTFTNAYLMYQILIFCREIGKNIRYENTIDSIYYYFNSINDIFLRDENLSDIPEEIFFLHQLVTLNLSKNQLCLIPSYIINLVKLTQLFLCNNQIHIFPEEICQLLNLKILNLNNNNIIKIPENISNLTNLTHLSLSFNKIASFPKKICCLQNLKHLYMSFNYLLYNLIYLKHLYICRQKIPMHTFNTLTIINIFKQDIHIN